MTIAAMDYLAARSPDEVLEALADGDTVVLAGGQSLVLDLADARDRATVEELLASADVVVQGYRPGALDVFGMDPAALAQRHPHLVVVRLSAWGSHGPWAGRRGFDSMVQAATGIATTYGSPEEPGVLPAQALDHATGYLATATVLAALVRQREEGGGGRGHVRPVGGWGETSRQGLGI